ncbi:MULTISPECIES: hypothetical protein [Cytobacillus]|uniref:Bacterial Pleckstrin homology domain-containing protein n=2 Tax=Cytobacillus TaxID=2675230 RepID=A0AA46SMF8_CYTFI|nr:MULTISPECIES: hypothetical protein [Cytobacillus]AND43198.1 hypothetical protein A361_28980 [Cytobacillus oceanisediminis 2691]MCM3244531.1 hypothetical protein [Cytobacillus oceanisediminis]USK47255.1 hypothetical protein LIT27_29190 [Cytobacillus oceanisediminis]UYG98300.1 hypothetical protein OD459_25875 [Cytobacillus firmus]
MSQQVLFEKDEMIIKFTGLTMLAGLKKELRLPYKDIKGVETSGFKLHWLALRIGGTSLPNGYKAGRFVYKAERYFLHYSNPNNVVQLLLEGHDFDKVVIEVGKPKEIKNAILKRLEK